MKFVNLNKLYYNKSEIDDSFAKKKDLITISDVDSEIEEYLDAIINGLQ